MRAENSIRVRNAILARVLSELAVQKLVVVVVVVVE